MRIFSTLGNVKLAMDTVNFAAKTNGTVIATLIIGVEIIAKKAMKKNVC